MTDPETRLNYQLSERDFVRAHRIHLRRSLLTVKTLVLLTTALAIGMVQAQMFGGEDWALRIFGAIWAAVILFMLYAFLFLPRKLYRRVSRHGAEQEIRFDREGLMLIQEGEPAKYTWDEVVRTEDSRDFVYLHLKSSSGGGLPVVIPKRAFETPNDIARIHEFAARALKR